MASGPPQGERLRQLWERAGQTTKVTRAGTTVFGTRASAVRPSAVGSGEARALFHDSYHAETLRESCGTRFAGCGSGREWLEMGTEERPGYQAAIGWRP